MPVEMISWLRLVVYYRDKLHYQHLPTHRFALGLSHQNGHTDCHGIGSTANPDHCHVMSYGYLVAHSRIYLSSYLSWDFVEADQKKTQKQKLTGINNKNL